LIWLVGDTREQPRLGDPRRCSGELIDPAQFSTTTAGVRRAHSWAANRIGGDLDALWVIEVLLV
jgi:hypothetical protein